jgi:hypothetical protein
MLAPNALSFRRRPASIALDAAKTAVGSAK